MIETSIPELRVDDLMRKIREEIAKAGPLPPPLADCSEPAVSVGSPLSSHLPPPVVGHAPLARQDDYQLGEFLQFGDVDFVREAYRAVLRREPDEGGLGTYVSALRGGLMTKAEVLGRLLYSPEGRQHGVRVAGLRVQYLLQRSFKLPVAGYFLRLFSGLLLLPSIIRSVQSLDALAACQALITRHQFNVHRDHWERGAAALDGALAGVATRHELQTAVERGVETYWRRESGPLAEGLDAVRAKLDDKADRGEMARSRELREALERLGDLEEQVRLETSRLRDLAEALEKAQRDVADLDARKAEGDALEGIAESKADRELVLTLEKRLAGRDDALVASRLEALTERLEQVAELEETKADRTELQELEQRKADRSEALDLDARKLDREEALEWLTRKADQSALAEMDGRKADRDEMQAFAESKADRSEVRALAESKADRDEVRALVESKADRDEVRALDKSKVEMKELLGWLDHKADRGEVRDIDARKADRHELQAIDARKLERADLQELDERKADRQDIQDMTAGKADRAELDALVAAGQADRASIERLISGKADQADLEALTACKADKADLERLAERKADRQDVQALTQDKADRSDVAHLDARKAERVEVQELVDRKADRQDVQALTLGKADRSDVAHLDARKAERVEVQELVDRKADRQDVQALAQDKADRLELRELDGRKAERQEMQALEGGKASLAQLNEALASLATKGDISQIQNMETKLRAHSLQIVDNDRRLRLLLEEARKRFPEPMGQEELQTFAQEQSRIYEAMYFAFEDRFRGSREEIKLRQSVYLPTVRDILGSTPAWSGGARVLDLGCGRGEWLELLQDEGLAAQGVDVSAVMVRQCRERGLEVMEAEVIEFLRGQPDGSFSLISAFHLVEHLPLERLVTLFDECVRVLRPGGGLLLETPNPENLLTGACNFYMDLTHQRPIPPLALEYLVEARGFTRVNILRLNENKSHPPLADALVESLLFGPQDYAVIGRR